MATKPPPKTLIVSWPLKPVRGGSVQIVENLLKAFSATEVVVIGELPLFGLAPATRPSHQPQAYYFRSGFSIFGRGARFFTWIRWMMFRLLVAKICRVAKRENCDRILGIFPDEFFCYAACLAAEKLNLPFSTYFHNTYLDNEAVDQKRGVIIQPKLFSSSEYVFVMSQGMKKFFEEKHGLGNVVPLVHTFDQYPETFEAPCADISGKDKIKLVLFGNFNHSNIEATARFVDAVAQDPRYSISLYTHVPTSLLRMRGINIGPAENKGYIDDSTLISELQQYDVAVLTHGFDGAYGSVEYRTIFPTRTIPMLLSGKPIFVHSPPNSFLSDFVTEHNIGCLVDEPDEEKVMAELKRLVGDHRYACELVKNAKKTASMFHGPNVASILRGKLGISGRDA